LLVIHPFAGAFDLSQADHLPRDIYVNQNALARENSTMAKKDINNVNQIETEIKAMAKAVGASLKRQGHVIPHSAVLHAVSASLNRRDWHKLKVAISGDEPSAPTHPSRTVSNFPDIRGFSNKEDSNGVSAQFWTDDHQYEVSFEVTKALVASSDDHLERILWMGTSDNDCVDALALYMSSTEPVIQEALKYVGTIQASGRTMGFECSIDIREFRQWMDANRRIVLARWFCQEESIELRTRQSNSGDTFYDWAHQPANGQSEVTGWDFATEEAALLDAYEKRGRECGFIDRV
jgi:hypothetical protein